MRVDQREKNVLKVLGYGRKALRWKASLGEESGEVAATLPRRGGEQSPCLIQMSLFAPRLLVEQSQGLLRVFKLDHKLALATSQFLNCFVSNELARIDDHHARADLLHFGEQVAGEEDGFALVR